jgi:tRNA-2-methylthio-N6-dimethylallyladenosine synthase
MNVADSESWPGDADGGYEMTDNEEEADAIFLNTCSCARMRKKDLPSPRTLHSKFKIQNSRFKIQDSESEIKIQDSESDAPRSTSPSGCGLHAERVKDDLVKNTTQFGVRSRLVHEPT